MRLVIGPVKEFAWIRNALGCVFLNQARRERDGVRSVFEEAGELRFRQVTLLRCAKKESPTCHDSHMAFTLATTASGGAINPARAFVERFNLRRGQEIAGGRGWPDAIVEAGEDEM